MVETTDKHLYDISTYTHKLSFNVLGIDLIDVKTDIYINLPMCLCFKEIYFLCFIFLPDSRTVGDSHESFT